MPIIYSQASFKNSRIASRKPTTHAHTIRQVIAVGEYKKVLDVDITRTYATLINVSLADSLRYSYGDIGVLIDTDGMLLKGSQGADLEAPEEIWVKNVGAAPIDLQIDYGQG
jgi:hypothetical protein